MTTEEIWPPNIVNRSLIIYPDDKNEGFCPSLILFLGGLPPLFYFWGAGALLVPPPAPPPVKGLQLLAYDNGFVTCNSV